MTQCFLFSETCSTISESLIIGLSSALPGGAFFLSLSRFPVSFQTTLESRVHFREGHFRDIVWDIDYEPTFGKELVIWRPSPLPFRIFPSLIKTLGHRLYVRIIAEFLQPRSFLIITLQAIGSVQCCWNLILDYSHREKGCCCVCCPCVVGAVCRSLSPAVLHGRRPRALSVGRGRHGASSIGLKWKGLILLWFCLRVWQCAKSML